MSTEKPIKKTFWTKKRKKEFIIGGVFIAIALFGTFGVYAILKVALKTELPVVVVTSESMEPNIMVGDLLFVEGRDPATIKNGTHEDKLGDVIVYDAVGLWPFNPDGNQPIVHRVVGKYYNENDSQYYFITQGDNNPMTDPPTFGIDEIPVPASRVKGVVITIIPKIGYVKIWLTDSGIGTPLIIILGALLVISIVWDIIHPGEEEEEKKEKEKVLEQYKQEKPSTSSQDYDLGV